MLKIVYLLLAVVVLYFKFQKDKKNKQAKPYAKPDNGRKDGEFSLDDLLRRLQPEEMKPPAPAEVIPETTTYRKLEKTVDKLPFEKRKRLEKNETRVAKSREITPEVVDYDEAGIAKAKAHEHGAHRVLTDSKNIRFNFGEENSEVHEWFDARQAIIYQEILRRPEY